MADTDFTFGFRAEGVDEALRQAGRVEQANAGVARGAQQAAQQTGRAATATTASLNQVGMSVSQVGQRTGQTISALGAFTSSLGTISPAARMAGSVISQLGGAVGALSGAMGPFGVALGVATIALNLYQAATASSAEANTTAEDATRRHREEVDRLGSSARTAAQQLAALQNAIAERDAEARNRRLAQGQFGSTEDARIQAERLRQLEAEGRRRGGTAAEIFGGSAEEAARIEAQAAAGTFEQPPESRRGGGGGRRAQADTFRSDNGAALRQMLEDANAGGADALEFAAGLGSDGYAEKAQARFEEQKERMQEMRRSSQEAAREQQRLLAQMDDRIIAFQQSTSSSLEEVVRAWREMNDAMSEAGQVGMADIELMRVGLVAAGNEIADTVGNTMVGAFESALGAWLDGSKSFVEAAEDMVRGVLKALVIESIVQAVTETARGIADLAGYKYDTAALHFAAAAAWAAVGGVAGGVGAAIGGFGGGGKDAPSASNTVTPTDASTSAQQSQPMVINVYPGGFITRRDVSAGIVDALNEAGRDGYRLDPGLVGG